MLSLADVSLADSPLQTKGADVAVAQQALDKVVRYTQGDKASPTSIICAIDFEPFEFFESLGLTSTEAPITE